MDASWYVIITKPRQEIRAQEHLLAQGGKVFLPLIESESIKQGKRVSKFEALFPGYLFLDVQNNPSLLNSVRSTRGVNRLLSFGSDPLKIMSKLVDDICLRLKQGIDDNALYESGQSVRIENGLFRYYTAVIGEYEGEKRAIILLSILNQQQELLIALDDLRLNQQQPIAVIYYWFYKSNSCASRDCSPNPGAVACIKDN